jgi:hypothetical protein
VIVWVELMPFLIPVHEDQSKANTRWAAVGKPVASCAKVGLVPHSLELIKVDFFWGKQDVVCSEKVLQNPNHGPPHSK